VIEAGKTYNTEMIKKLAEVPVEEYCKVIKSKKDEEMRSFIFSALNFRRISNATPEMLEVVRRMEEALKRIGAESKLNAARVRRFGISVG
jgi:hypothetical protein